MKKKLKQFLKKAWENKWKIIPWVISIILSSVCAVLFGKLKKQEGVVSNLRDINSGLQKTVERQTYIIGKQNQKLYGGK